MTIKYIRECSDIHIEIGNPFIIPHMDEDPETVLIIAGDLHTGAKGIFWLEQASKQFHSVIYVLGNHEFYRHSIEEVVPSIQRELDSCEITNVYVCSRGETIIIDDVRFVCATLWSDMNENQEETIQQVNFKIHDFRLIRKNHYTSSFTPTDAIYEFNLAKEYIGTELAKPFDGINIVITHFLPSFKSVPEQFRTVDMYALNGYYASSLDHFILYHAPQFWFHGHTHDTRDYVIGNTRIICNPTGYYPSHMNNLFNDRLRITLQR